jgi:hypothetical protein
VDLKEQLMRSRAETKRASRDLMTLRERLAGYGRGGKLILTPRVHRPEAT